MKLSVKTVYACRVMAQIARLHAAGRLAHEQLLALPLQWVECSDVLLEGAAAEITGEAIRGTLRGKVEEVLREAGFSSDEIAALRASGAAR